MAKSVIVATINRESLNLAYQIACENPVVVFSTLDDQVFSELDDLKLDDKIAGTQVFFYEPG